MSPPLQTAVERADEDSRYETLSVNHDRYLDAGANTPEYLTKWALGAGEANRPGARLTRDERQSTISVIQLTCSVASLTKEPNELIN